MSGWFAIFCVFNIEDEISVDLYASRAPRASSDLNSTSMHANGCIRVKCIISSRSSVRDHIFMIRNGTVTALIKGHKCILGVCICASAFAASSIILCMIRIKIVCCVKYFHVSNSEKDLVECPVVAVYIKLSH